MNAWMGVFVAGVVAAVAGNTARGQVVLQIKFPPGASYRQTQTVVIDQTSTEGPVVRKTKSSQRFVLGIANGQPSAEGITPVEITTLELQMNMDLPDGSQLAFDSTQPPQPSENPVFQVVGQLVEVMSGARLTYFVDAKRQVVGVEGMDAIVERAPPETVPALQERLDATRLADRFQEEINRLPAEPIRPGQRWRQPYQFDLDGGQRMVFERHYQYVGPVKNSGGAVHEIRIADANVEYSLEEVAGSPIALKQSQLKVVQSGGRMFFHAQLGRVVESHVSTRVAGDLTLTLGNAELASKLDLTFTNDSATEDAPRE